MLVVREEHVEKRFPSTYETPSPFALNAERSIETERGREIERDYE